MKSIFLTIAIGFTVLTTEANHFSALNLKMFDNGNFSVVLDDQPACSKAGFFSAPVIEPGYHKLKVVRYFSTPYGYSMMQKVVYKGWINIPARSVVYANISCHNEFDVVKVEPYFCPPHGHGHGHGHGNGNGWEDDDEYDESGYENGYGHEGNGWGAPTPQPLPMCMSQMEFMQLKNSIESKSFESSKLQIAKQALSYNNFTSAQITDLMSAFDFESTKLDFAKSAYGKVIDKQNFYLVNNSFAFESSIQELNQFIAGK